MRTLTLSLCIASAVAIQPAAAASDHLMSALVHYFAEQGIKAYQYGQHLGLAYLVYNVTSNAYQQAVVTPNVSSVEHRLLELEASINGFVAQRRSKRSVLDDEARERLWNIVDELLELRSRSYDLAIGGAMADELHSLAGKADALADRAWALLQ